MNDKVFEETGALDTPIRAALDCAKAKNLLNLAEADAKEQRLDMTAAKERLLAFEYEKLDDPEFKHLEYPVGILQPGHVPKLLQLRRHVDVAKGRIYTPENLKRIEELRATAAAMQAEIDRVPFTPDDHEVVSWHVWLVDAPEKPSKKK